MCCVFQISKFSDTLSLVIIPSMFCRNLTKIGQIHIPFIFAQSGCIPPKTKMRDVNSLRFANNSCHARRLSRILKPQTGVNDGSKIPGKVTHCRHVSFYHLDRSVERLGERHNNEQSCQRQRKNPRQRWKNHYYFISNSTVFLMSRNVSIKDVNTAGI